MLVWPSCSLSSDWTVSLLCELQSQSPAHLASPFWPWTSKAWDVQRHHLTDITHYILTAVCHIKVAAMDLQGMGRSEGYRWYVHAFQHYVDDMGAFVAAVHDGVSLGMW